MNSSARKTGNLRKTVVSIFATMTWTPYKCHLLPYVVTVFVFSFSHFLLFFLSPMTATFSSLKKHKNDSKTFIYSLEGK